MRAEFYEELPYFVVEKNDQNDNSDADELVHYGAHELHVENTGYDHPYPDKDEDTGKDVYHPDSFIRRYKLYNSVATIRMSSMSLMPKCANMTYADRVLVTIFTVSTASRTSCTRKM